MYKNDVIITTDGEIMYRFYAEKHNDVIERTATDDEKFEFFKEEDSLKKQAKEEQSDANYGRQGKL